MSAAPLPLHRLLRRETAETLLKSFAPLLPGEKVALFSPEGRLFAGQRPDDRPAAGIAETSARFAGAQPVFAGDLVFYPVRVNQQVSGIIAARRPSPVLEALQNAFELLLAQSYEKHEIARETLDRYREVNLLYYVAETISANLDPSAIPQLILREAHRIIQAPYGVFVFYPQETDQPEIRASFGDEDGVTRLFQLLREHIGAFISIVTPDVLVKPGDGSAVPQVVMYAPVHLRDRVIGLVAVGRPAAQPLFTAGDLKLLKALANQARIGLEKAYAQQQEILQQSLEQELSIGQNIQRSLLPGSLPVVPGWEFAAGYQAARQVGGDLYDLFPVEVQQIPGRPPQRPTQYNLMVADVTGKGVPAALMMAFSRATLHAAAMISPHPSKVLRLANDSILRESHSGLFLTIFYAQLDTVTGQLRYANGGHETPMWYHAATGELSEVKCARSLLLGAFPHIAPGEMEIVLAPGDILVLYTDGITEARDASGQFFTEDRLKHAILAKASRGAQEIVDAICHSLAAFTDGVPQADDITLLVVKRI